MDILPQIAQMTQRNTAELYYPAEKDRLMWFMRLLLFWLLSAIICVISVRLIGFHLC